MTLPVQRPKMWSWKLNCPTQELMSCGILRTKEIKPSSKYKIEAHGKIYKLTVLNMMKDDEGEYTFYAGENRTSGKLTVAG